MFGISFITPWLLAGSVLIAAPILIHILSKRKYRIIAWAAMDFLLEADRRNRRRVRLESLLLLLLRCLAILLIAMLVARPVIPPAGLIGAAMPTVPIERIVLLDDSPSMAAVAENKTAFEQAAAGLVEFVRELSRQRQSDTFTLRLTSHPEQPLFNGEKLGGERTADIIQRLEQLKPSDLSARLDQALATLETSLEGTTGRLHRMIYVVSDLRQADWQPSAMTVAATDETVPTEQPLEPRIGMTGLTAPDQPGQANTGGAGLAPMLKRLGAKSEGVYIVDAGGASGGGGGAENLAIIDIAPLDKALAKGVESRFEVTVANYGQSEVDDLDVTFKAQGALELHGRIPTLRAGGVASVPFTYTFRQVGSVPIEARMGPDALEADNTRLYAARVNEGVHVLLVDGDPSSVRGRSETFFLDYALSPPGDVPSGYVVETVGEGQFEGMALDRFQAIFVCNLYRISEDRLKALRAYVAAGGGLVFCLGDQVDAEVYNGLLYDEGRGLLPIKLTQIKGDDSQREWVNLGLEAANHPALEVFGGSNNPFFKTIKVFRWWGSEALEQESRRAGEQGSEEGIRNPQSEIRNAASVLMRYTDIDASPAIVEKSYGAGRVMVITTPTDGAWNTWPNDPSYVVAMLETTRYIARKAGDQGTQAVATPIHFELDSAKYAMEAKITGPDGETSSYAATPAPDGKTLVVHNPDTDHRGFYSVALTKHGGEAETLLFAANIDPAEGQLQRANTDALQQQLGDARVQIIRGKASLTQATVTAGLEVWTWILLVLAGVLCVEQLLAWAFGRKR
ncbi:MAG: BatA domain-containing protein [Phycisphaeraceae bacterium]